MTTYKKLDDRIRLVEVISMTIYKIADELINKAMKKANEINVPMVLAVVDEGGNLIQYRRMEGSLLVSVDVAQGKAYTALALNMPTGEVAKIIGPGGPIYGMEATNHGKIVAFGGGFPIYHEGKLIGGFGVSGGSVEEDVMCASYALENTEGVDK